MVLQQYSDLLHPSFSRVISMCVNMVRVIHTLSRFYWCAFILDSVCVCLRVDLVHIPELASGFRVSARRRRRAKGPGRVECALASHLGPRAL